MFKQGDRKIYDFDIKQKGKLPTQELPPDLALKFHDQSEQ
jgi:hypothetical protein